MDLCCFRDSISSFGDSRICSSRSAICWRISTACGVESKSGSAGDAEDSDLPEDGLDLGSVIDRSYVCKKVA